MTTFDATMIDAYLSDLAAARKSPATSLPFSRVIIPLATPSESSEAARSPDRVRADAAIGRIAGYGGAVGMPRNTLRPVSAKIKFIHTNLPSASEQSPEHVEVVVRIISHRRIT